MLKARGNTLKGTMRKMIMKVMTEREHRVAKRKYGRLRIKKRRKTYKTIQHQSKIPKKVNILHYPVPSEIILLA